MTKFELAKILYALRITFGDAGTKLFKKLLEYIKL